MCESEIPSPKLSTYIQYFEENETRRQIFTFLFPKFHHIPAEHFLQSMRTYISDDK